MTRADILAIAFTATSVASLAASNGTVAILAFVGVLFSFAYMGEMGEAR